MKLNSQQLQEYCNYCDDYIEINTGRRIGQAYCDVLEKLHPELAKEIKGTDVDPFYDDRVLPSFFKYIKA